MSHLFFDLNIFNYSLNELKSLINLPEVYNFNVIGDNILTIKEKILDLKLPENENNEYMCVFIIMMMEVLCRITCSGTGSSSFPPRFIP